MTHIVNEMGGKKLKKKKIKREIKRNKLENIFD